MAMPIKESGKRKDDKKHLFPRLGRKASLKEEDFPRVEKDSKNGHKAIETHDDKSQKASRTPAEDHHHSAEKERGFRDMMSSTLRNRSADRHAEAKNESSDDNGGVGHVQPARSAKLVKPIGREENGPGFLSSFGNKAAGGLGRAAKGLVKLGRSGSTNEREVPPAPREPYIPTVITQPLIDQTHLTRISKRLEDCRDKTEFWMPALPWRCIDYLNAKAPNSEGIYRVPGSDRDVKHWEQRFDKGMSPKSASSTIGDADHCIEHDIDLLSPGTPIYDINTIGSMLKNWLRALPDNIVPLDVQNEVQSVVTENGTKTAPEQAPQELKDALSNLPPFNYYLLFAITCHISLLNAHPETTKMHFTALRICLQPCLRISPLFFQWLVQDWRNCWQGCWTEKEYLEKEYAWLKEQEESASLAASIKQRDQQTSRQSERSVTPLGAVARDAPSRERDRSKASQKDSKKIKDDKGRALHAYENSALPSQSPSNAIPQQVVMGGSKAAVQALSQHKHTASNSSNRPPTAHAPLSTAFDPIQAAHATSQSNRASANSMPFGMEGRSTPETHPVRDASLPRKQQNGLSATKPGRDSSRDRAREHGLMLRLNEKDGKPEQSTEKRSERTADAADVGLFAQRRAQPGEDRAVELVDVPVQAVRALDGPIRKPQHVVQGQLIRSNMAEHHPTTRRSEVDRRDDTVHC